MNNVYKKLQAARVKLQSKELKKSGKNKFAGYEYFELGDFIPSIQDIFAQMGLCGVISYGQTVASLTIYDSEAEGHITFESPMSSAALKGCHEVQNLGAVQTYLRRYLWMTALEIVEHDPLDASTGDATKTVEKPKAVVPKKIEGADGEWQIKATLESGGTPEEWLKMVSTGCTMALDMATKPDDVLKIFKKNKTLFDEVKKQDAEFFKELMAKFTEVKTKLAGE